MRGTVKWFNPRRGYGFITYDDGKDIYVHFTGISGTGYKYLVDGQTVDFEIAQNERGLEAVKVHAYPKPKNQ